MLQAQDLLVRSSGPQRMFASCQVLHTPLFQLCLVAAGQLAAQAQQQLSAHQVCDSVQLSVVVPLCRCTRRVCRGCSGRADLQLPIEILAVLNAAILHRAQVLSRSSWTSAALAESELQQVITREGKSLRPLSVTAWAKWTHSNLA